jgi:hypothetical protein
MEMMTGLVLAMLFALYFITLLAGIKTAAESDSVTVGGYANASLSYVRELQQSCSCIAKAVV